MFIMKKFTTEETDEVILVLNNLNEQASVKTDMNC